MFNIHNSFLGLTEENLKNRQGYLQALYDIDEFFTQETVDD